MACVIFIVQREEAWLMCATILIVDDDQQFRTLMRRIPELHADLRVVGEAADGAEAIRCTHELRPDLVLLDLVMPGVNGLEATLRIKAEHPEIKVIIVTVHTEDAYRRAAEASGADAFLLKKTLMTVLLPTIRRLLAATSPPRPHPEGSRSPIADVARPRTSRDPEESPDADPSPPGR
jgi:two-component system, NarL family, response regulator